MKCTICISKLHPQCWQNWIDVNPTINSCSVCRTGEIVHDGLVSNFCFWDAARIIDTFNNAIGDIKYYSKTDKGQH